MGAAQTGAAFPPATSTLASTTLGWRLVNPRMQDEWTCRSGRPPSDCASAHGISRERQDEFALRSHRSADQAWDDGFYDDQVVPSPATTLTRDECIRPDTSIDQLGTLKPVFRPDGTVTAGNASPLNDGASQR